MLDVTPLTAAPTLLAVHAHPDDEATSTGGILARYSAEGVRTVVVTCTNGECGDGPDGVKPGEPGHDPAAVVATRRAELEKSCEILGVARLELLGFHDSGMEGWPQNEAADSFWRLPVERGMERLAPLIERYAPDVVVTYGPDGFYGHPDHIQTHRVTLAALEATGSRARVFFPVIPASAWQRFLALRAEAGEELSDSTEPQYPSMHFPDDELAAVVDCRAYAVTAFEALSAHQSQVQNFAMLAGGPERFAEWFGRMAFARGRAGMWDGCASSGGDASPAVATAPGKGSPLDDLFAPAPAG